MRRFTSDFFAVLSLASFSLPTLEQVNLTVQIVAGLVAIVAGGVSLWHRFRPKRDTSGKG
jgi:hypothetical protein